MPAAVCIMVFQRRRVFPVTEKRFGKQVQTWDGQTIIFYFSSLVRMHRFSSKINCNVPLTNEENPINESMQRRFGFNMGFQILEAVQHYRRIETTGFLISIEGSEATCPEQLIFTDRVQIRK